MVEACGRPRRGTVTATAICRGGDVSSGLAGSAGAVVAS